MRWLVMFLYLWEKYQWDGKLRNFSTSFPFSCEESFLVGVPMFLCCNLILSISCPFDKFGYESVFLNNSFSRKVSFRNHITRRIEVHRNHFSISIKYPLKRPHLFTSVLQIKSLIGWRHCFVTVVEIHDRRMRQNKSIHLTFKEERRKE